MTTTEPYNQHFLRDIGLIFLLLSVALGAGVAHPAPRTALWSAAALWLSGHALFHVWEVAAGICRPSALKRDFGAVTLPGLITTLLTIWAAPVSLRSQPLRHPLQRYHARIRRPEVTPRITNPAALFPAGIKAMMALEQTLHAGGLDQTLLELVKLRASQINGCAYCIHLHTTFLRKAGVEEMRLYMLDAWRESSLYSERERAALGWTEALTRLAETKAPQADYDALSVAFSPEEQVQLTLAIGAINIWNRLQVGFRVAHPVDGHHAVA